MRRYTKKYAEEADAKTEKLANKCYDFFQRNAVEAEKQFGHLLHHFNNLCQLPEYHEYNKNAVTKTPSASTVLSKLSKLQEPQQVKS
jgi:hypothetical protein